MLVDGAGPVAKRGEGERGEESVEAFNRLEVLLVLGVLAAGQGIQGVGGCAGLLEGVRHRVGDGGVGEGTSVVPRKEGDGVGTLLGAGQHLFGGDVHSGGRGVLDLALDDAVVASVLPKAKKGTSKKVKGVAIRIRQLVAACAGGQRVAGDAGRGRHALD